MHIPFLPATLAATLVLAGTAARADTLAGTWSGHADGRPISLSFDGRGGGWFDGRPIRYTTSGSTLTVEDQGETRLFQYQLNAGQLLVGGGNFQTTIVLSRAIAAAPAPAAPQPPRPVAQPPAVPPPVAVAPPVRPPAPAQPARPPAAAPATGGTPSELVGKWCQASTYTASTGGGARQSACFDLRADGSYRYESARAAEDGGRKDREEERERRQSGAKDGAKDGGKDGDKDRQQAGGKDGDRDRQQARDKDGEKDRQQARGKDGEKDRQQGRGKDGEKDGDRDQDREAGRWTATDTTLTADPRKGAPTTYRLERRNHPATRAPMLCLNGDCYVTTAKRQPW